MAKSGGFSKADVQILVETNLQQVVKETANTTKALSDLQKIITVMNKHINGMNRNLKTQANSLKQIANSMVELIGHARNAIVQLNRVNKSTKNIQKSSHGVISKMRDWLVVIGQIRSAFLNLKMLTTDVFGYILKVGSKFEKLEVLLSGLSKESTTEKRIDDVRNKIDYLIDTAKNAPFSLDAIQDAFVKLDTVGLQPTEGSLQGLIDAVAAFGGGEEHIKRAAIALQQMAGKGVVSMEELRQQLGESVPTALQMMAKGAGISIGELVKHISKGTVEAKTAIQIMNREFIIAYSGASEKLMETGEGLVSRIKTLILTLSRDMAEQSGVYDGFKNVLKELVEYLGSPEATQNAIELGVTLNLILKIVVKLVKVLYEFKTLIGGIITYLSFKTIFGKVISGLSGLDTGFKKLKKALVAAMKAGDGLTGVFGKLFATFGKGNIIAVGLAAIAAIALKVADNFAQAAHNADVLHKNLLKVKNAKSAGVELDEDDIDYDTGSLKHTRQQKKQTEETIKLLNKQILLYKQSLENLKPKTKAYEEIEKSLQIANKQLDLEKEKLEGILQVLDVLEQKHTEHKVSQSEYIQNIVDVYELRKNQLMEEYRAREEEINKIQDGYVREKEIAKERTKYAGLIGDAFYKVAEILGNIKGEARVELAIQKLINKEAEKRIELQNALLDGTGLKFIDAESDIANIQKQIEGDMKRLANIKSKLEDGGVYTNFAKSSQINKVEEDYNKFLKENKYEEKNIEERRKLQEKYWSQLDNQIQRAEKSLQQYKLTTEGAQKASQRSINKLNEEYEKYDRMLASARENLAKGVEPLTQTVTLESRLAAELNNVADANKKAALEDKNRKAVENERLARSLNSLYNLQQENVKIAAEIYAEKTDNLDAYLAYHEKRLRDELQMDIGSAEEKLLKQQELDKSLKLLREKYINDNKTDLQKTLDEWSKVGRQIDSVWSDMFEDLSDKLYDFLKTGEADWRSFAETVVESIAKIMIKAALAQITLKAMSAASSFFGSGTSSGVSEKKSGSSEREMWTSFAQTAAMLVMAAHTGAVIGKESSTPKLVSPDMFVNATRYHTGGVAGLKPDEVPAILQKGEGVFTEEQMKAMGGSATPPVNVAVNVINQTQQDVGAEQGDLRFDGQQMVLDVVLRAASQPGAFRDNMRSALK